MSKKNVIIGICATLAVAAIVYIIGGFIIKSVSHDGKSSDEVREKTVNTSDDAVSDKTIDNDTALKEEVIEGDIFEYFRDKSFKDAVAYSNEMTRRQITMDKSNVTFTGSNGNEVTFASPYELNDESVIAVDFLDDEKGVFFVEEEASAGNIYYSVFTTVDGGRNWEEKNPASFAGEIVCVHMIDDSNIAVISGGGAYATNVINVSDNMADNWNVIDNEIIEQENGIVYPIRITVQERVFLVAGMDNETVNSAIMYKLGSDWSVEDSYEVRVG